MSEESFDLQQIEHALATWIDFGERSLGMCHNGYYAGEGWAARVLRYLHKQCEIQIEQQSQEKTLVLQAAPPAAETETRQG